MLPGSMPYTSCFPPVCGQQNGAGGDPDVDVPKLECTKIFAVTNHSFSGFINSCTADQPWGQSYHTGASKCDNDLQGFPAYPNECIEFYRIWEYEFNYYGKGVWPLVSETLTEASAGTVIRASDKTPIAEGPIKFYMYLFGPAQVEEVITEPKLGTTATTFTNIGCCASQINTNTVNETIVSGTQTRTLISTNQPSSAFSWRTIAFPGVARRDWIGIKLLQKVAGAAIGPWTIIADGTSLIMKSTSGGEYTYTGTISSVASAINAAGFFSATVGEFPTVSVLSGARTEDLVERTYKVETTLTGGCYTNVIIVAAGTEVAPSYGYSLNGLKKFGYRCGTVAESYRCGCSDLFNANETSDGFSPVPAGFDDTIDGFRSWITQGFNEPLMIPLTHNGDPGCIFQACCPLPVPAFCQCFPVIDSRFYGGAISSPCGSTVANSGSRCSLFRAYPMQFQGAPSSAGGLPTTTLNFYHEISYELGNNTFHSNCILPDPVNGYDCDPEDFFNSCSRCNFPPPDFCELVCPPNPPGDDVYMVCETVTYQTFNWTFTLTETQSVSGSFGIE